MKPRVFKLANRLATSQWLVPVLLELAGLGLGIVLPILDMAWGGHFTGQGWLGRLVSASPEGARALLSTGAGALASIAAVAFSLALVTLQLAATQYTPRLLRRFLADRITQVFLGLLTGTVTYLLFVLRSVSAREDRRFAPHLSSMVGLALVVICLGMLAVFLYHLARLVQPATIVKRVADETLHTLNHQPLAADLPAHRPSPAAPATWLRSEARGYVQLTDARTLLRAAPHGAREMRVVVRPGDFLVPGMRVLALWPERTLTPREAGGLHAALVVGRERTPAQDPLFGVRQLVDVALKALSPAINDVTTALEVVNQVGVLGQAMVAGGIGARRGWRLVRRGCVAALLPVFGLENFLEEALAEIRRSAVSHPRVLARCLEILAELSRQAGDPARQRVICAEGLQLRDFAHRLDLSGSEARQLDERSAWLAEGPSDAGPPPPEVH